MSDATIAIMTGAPTGVEGEDLGYPSSNVNLVLDAMIDREVTPALFKTDSVMIDEGGLCAVVARLQPDGPRTERKVYSSIVHTRPYSIISKRIEPLEELAGIYIRGDDLQLVPGVERVLERLERPHIPIHPVQMLLTKDKWDSAQRLADIGVPSTYHAHDHHQLEQALEGLRDQGGAFAILKYRYGSGGAQVVRIGLDRGDALDAALAFLARHKDIIVQEYDESAPRGDIRAHTYLGRYVGAIERIPPPGDWKASITQGGMWRTHRPYEGEERLCERIAARYPGIDYLGIDLFHSLRLIEVNGYPASVNELYDAHGFDVADRLVQSTLKRQGVSE